MKTEELYLGILNDGMNALGYTHESYFIDIKPVAGYQKLIFGPAFTTFGEVVDQNVVYSGLDNIRLEMYKPENFKINPIVVLQANDDSVAHSGDITSMIYQKLGAAGFVTDGNVRDTELIDKIKFPVFASSHNPIDAIDFWALTKYQVDLVIKGIRVRPGDFLFCSNDGIIVCPYEVYDDLVEKMNEVLNKEAVVRAKIEAVSAEDLYDTLVKLVETEGRW
jgi:regulator of RNase E activity RraA